MLKVKFLDSNSPSDVAVSSARTCYSGKGLVTPEESSEWKRKPDLLLSIFKSGHHTTLQHTHITMTIEGISRHLIWRLLHSHSHYNSEQISQRYAKMRLENMRVPKGADKSEWNEFYNSVFADYEKLIELLKEPIENVLPKFKKGEAGKKAQELARYVLPQGTEAYMYHTVNIITILRYIATAKALPEAKEEGLNFANQLAENLLKVDPQLKPLIDFAKEHKVEFPTIDIEKYSDKGLVFDVVGDLPKIDNSYSGILRTSQTFFDESMLGGFSSKIKLSLSADSQNQRHRRSLGVRPPLQKIYKKEFYTPEIIEKNSEVLKLYRESLERVYSFFEDQVQKIGFSEAVYALPNAHLIEILERNDFSSFQHKSQMRLCYNAQQEIYDITYKQVQELAKVKESADEVFLPPCSIRSRDKIYPICPEGVRFCGVKVWKLNFSEFHRDI